MITACVRCVTNRVAVGTECVIMAAGTAVPG
jgi:hypothetical protein